MLADRGRSRRCWRKPHRAVRRRSVLGNLETGGEVCFQATLFAESRRVELLKTEISERANVLGAWRHSKARREPTRYGEHRWPMSMAPNWVHRWPMSMAPIWFGTQLGSPMADVDGTHLDAHLDVDGTHLVWHPFGLDVDGTHLGSPRRFFRSGWPGDLLRLENLVLAGNGRVFDCATGEVFRLLRLSERRRD